MTATATSFAGDVHSSAVRSAGRGTVAVIGTGVVGLSAALGCAQRGFSVTLVGPAPASAVAGKGAPAPVDDSAWDARIYALSAASRALLEAQRVWQQLDATRLCPVARMEVHGDDGGRLAFQGPHAGQSPLATICEESALLRALWLACTLAPGLSHRPVGLDSAVFPEETGAWVATVPPVATAVQRGVRLNLADGAVLDADIVIGADGRQSAVRAAAGIGARLDDYGQTAIVANFACQWPHAGVARQWFTSEGIVALLPLPGERVSLVWSAPNERVPALQALSGAEFARRVAYRTHHGLGALSPITERHSFVLHRVVVDRLVRAGAVLLGDAAHVVHPLAGQGLNLGLQDVSEFLRVLDAREPWRLLGDGVWLRRYERARAEPVALMRTTVDALARLFGAPDDRVRWLRNAGMSVVDRLVPLKRALVRHAMG